MDMVIPTLTDPSIAPPGKHILSCFVQYAPYKLASGTWDDQREAFGDTVIDTIAEYAPNIRDIILHRQVRDAARSRTRVRADRREHLSRRADARATLLRASGAGLGAIHHADPQPVDVRIGHASRRRHHGRAREKCGVADTWANVAVRRSAFVVRRSVRRSTFDVHGLRLCCQFFLQPFRYTMNLVEHWIDRSASCWARRTRESFVSIVDETENSTKRALSAGRNRPKPSAMFLVDDAADARIWLRNSRSCDAVPVSVSVYTSRLSSSAICHASRSSYRLTPAMLDRLSNDVPEAECRTRNAKRHERRTSNHECGERRTPNHERRTT